MQPAGHARDEEHTIKLPKIVYTKQIVKVHEIFSGLEDEQGEHIIQAEQPSDELKASQVVERRSKKSHRLPRGQRRASQPDIIEFQQLPNVKFHNPESAEKYREIKGDNGLPNLRLEHQRSVECNISPDKQLPNLKLSY